MAPFPFCELNKKGLFYKKQVDVPIVYDGLTFYEGFRLDVLIEDLVICELKAVDNMHPVWKTQILNYPKLIGRQLDFRNTLVL
ncbi:MAG: GxxExxY protein [Chlamydiota bacterium]|nr:GxxExxY protein [Chlamydiota bacterium]